MIYAHDPGRRSRQIVGDLLLLMWCLGWILLGRLVHHLISLLKGPAQSLANAAGGLGEQVGSISGSLPRVLRGPLQGLEGNSAAIGGAASEQVEAISRVALLAGVTTAAVPIALALAIAIPLRLRWSSEARAANRLRSAPNFKELMARRAVVKQPLKQLARVTNDPVGDLDAGRYEALARLEMRSLGLKAEPGNQLSRPPS